MSHASSISWARHIKQYEAPGRAIVRTGTMIVAFGSRYARVAIDTLTGAALAVKQGNVGPSSQGAMASASADAGSASASSGRDASPDGGANGDGDGDGNGDGNGDGDGDGPRRKIARRKSATTRAARRRSPPPTRSSSERAHKAALIAFTAVTALLLSTVLAFGLNGQPGLAEKVLSAFVSVATVAAAFLRPK